MSFPKVTIQLVTWNSMKYLPFTLESIFNQNYKDFQVLVVDNNSQDETVDFIRKNYPEVTVFQNKKNLGFAKANNQGIRLLHSPFVLLCNPDIILENNWLEIIMKNTAAEKYHEVGSWGGKLLKLKPHDDEINQSDKTTIIDSCGLQITKNRKIIELGAGQDSAEFTNDQVVFGCSGALVLYKRELLDDCLIKTPTCPAGEYFDENFFAYKEDIDLAWRARILGWQSRFVSGAIAYHVRSASGSENTSYLEIIKSRRQLSPITKYYSYRNHLFLLIKNEFPKNFLTNIWRIKWLEFRKVCYFIIFEPKNILAWWAVMKMLPNMLAKRRQIFKQAKINSLEMAKWIK